ncbi:ESX secretion-associated protein EspG [Mycobacterium sp. 21AC1]|uniref:ESX secretion-associated protein EspG n=1 Tax=[Mycobacterium] appelbergii TaxID=2939269 RepID=UPI002938E2FB|nr:ESX secretion-associated protein EspG [Mycobacterium sp. 21AC1]MDV3128464.1 ESX secretion-associated protein EspG [Mycobacterium sp. 21AC1]
MTGALTQEWSFTADELAALTLRTSGPGAPAVLGLRPRHATVDVGDAALSHAVHTLTRRGVIVDGVVEPEIVTVLHALQRPDREFVMRLVTPAGIGRTSVVRRGALCVTARRVGEQLDVHVLGVNIALSDVAAALLGDMPAAHPAAIDPVGAPLSDMTEALSESHDPLVLADRIRALGVQQRAAVLLGAALGSRQAFAEIVYCVLVNGEDRIARVPAAVAVLYTGRGRVIAVPSISPSEQLWSTLKPGSDQVFGQAMSQLDQLSTESWEGG